MIECDKIITIMDYVSTKKKNVIATNFTSTTSINCHNKEVRDCYIIHSVLLVIMFLLIIVIFIFYSYYTGQIGIIWNEK